MLALKCPICSCAGCCQPRFSPLRVLCITVAGKTSSKRKRQVTWSEHLQVWKAAPACWQLMQSSLPPNPCLMSLPPSCQHPGAARSTFPVPPPITHLMLSETTGNTPIKESLPSPSVYTRTVASESLISSIILHLFFKGVGGGRDPIFCMKTPMAVKNYSLHQVMPWFRLILKPVFLMLLLYQLCYLLGKKDDLLPWHNRSCLSPKCFTQKCLHSCNQFVHTQAVVYKGMLSIRPIFTF